MSHEVEKMVFAGATPWHGLGTEIDDATTFWDAFKMAGLDWEVQTEPLFRGDGSEVKAQASVRQSDNRVLGVVGPRWTYPIELSHAQHYVSERLALVGDAAHAIHPLAGQGFNLGIRDVAILAELIVDRYRLGMDIGAIDLLSRYERWRRFDSVSLIVVTDGLNRLFSNNSEPVRLIRDVGLAAVNRTPLLKKLFMRHAMGLVGELPRLSRGESL